MTPDQEQPAGEWVMVPRLQFEFSLAYVEGYMSGESEEARNHVSRLREMFTAGLSASPAPTPAAPLSAQPVAWLRTYSDGQRNLRFAPLGRKPDGQDTPLYTTPPPPADARPVEMTAKPLNWEMVQPDTWADDTGFYITFDADEDEPYFAAWGEGDECRHATLEEAKQWCYDHLNAWVQKIAVAAPADARGSEALRLAQRMCREALPKFNWGASALDANAIDLLNRAPIAIDAALAASQAAPARQGEKS